MKLGGIGFFSKQRALTIRVIPNGYVSTFLYGDKRLVYMGNIWSHDKSNYVYKKYCGDKLNKET